MLKKIFTQLHPSYLEQYCVRVAPQVALALDLHQDLDIVVLGEGDGLLGSSGGHDGGQPGEEGGARQQEPRHHLDVHEEQGEHRHRSGVDHVHKTLPAVRRLSDQILRGGRIFSPREDLVLPNLDTGSPGDAEQVVVDQAESLDVVPVNL